MTKRALSFGPVAAAYERYRPDYPDRVVDEIVAYAGRPVRTALEIGAGTGKATRVFTARGIAVTASDPDPKMLEELRRHVPGPVSTLNAAFEDIPVDRTFDVIFAAASLHWTEPEQRWSRMTALLETGGTFAAFGAERRLADPQLESAVVAARAHYLEADELPPPDGTRPGSPMQWPGTELVRSDLFHDVRQVILHQSPNIAADHYVGHLSTVSAYLQLPESARRDVLGLIRAVLPDQVTVAADITLHLARSSPR